MGSSIGGAMTGSRRAREVWILVTITIASCAATVGLTLFLTSFSEVQSTASGNAGQSFGAAAAATSVVVLIYIARTFHQQGEESRMQREVLEAQRAELALQREVAENQHETARRVAEAAIREQHRRLFQMAFDDPLLMAVWPPYEPDIPADRTRQFMYANLVISHQCMCWELGYLDDESSVSNLYYLFSSAPMREFWERTRAARDCATPHSGKMRQFYDAAEMAYQRQLLNLTARPGADDLAEPR
ncbi:DUF6082 family protein [Streptomyces olivochromogenes]|uniref:DUF6082 family protein n=1 Tax=Streptomyces olivochromogenes TaxID=1963 RepID=UPI001F3AD6E0|nr:DUF6082 family protein [Streptomyces olivochromogenes]MCF3134045.1 hypothetical protein [Streptomyces olivochromogenes]